MSESLTETCRNCNGAGVFGAGRQIGPVEWEREVPCEACKGKGESIVRCVDCGEPAVVRVGGEALCGECASATRTGS